MGLIADWPEGTLLPLATMPSKFRSAWACCAAAPAGLWLCMQLREPTLAYGAKPGRQTAWQVVLMAPSISDLAASTTGPAHAKLPGAPCLLGDAGRPYNALPAEVLKSVSNIKMHIQRPNWALKVRWPCSSAWRCLGPATCGAGLWGSAALPGACSTLGQGAGAGASSFAWHLISACQAAALKTKNKGEFVIPALSRRVNDHCAAGDQVVCAHQ
jgi:hypothetical protein